MRSLRYALTLFLAIFAALGLGAGASAQSVTLVLPNNPAIVYSPGNWSAPTAQSALSINAGAYFSTMFSGSSITLTFDVTNLASPASEIYYRIDGYEAQSPFTVAQVAATIVVPMPADTSVFPWHVLEVVIKSTTQTQNRWVAPSKTAVILTGIQLASGAAVMAPGTAPGGSIILDGDSIDEAVRVVNQSAANDTDQNDAMMGWSYALRRLLGVEVGVNGFGGSGLIAGGNGGVPPLPQSYNLIMAGVPRPVPSNLKLVVLNEGTNDGSATTAAETAATVTTLNNLLVYYPGVPIAVMRPFAGYQADALQAGIAACNNPSMVHYIDTTGFLNNAFGTDSLGLHPSGPNDIGIIAPQVAAALKPLIYPSVSGRNYTFF